MAVAPAEVRDHSCDAADAPCAHRQRCIQVRWLVAATLFGAMFPVVGWLVAMSDPGVADFASAHRSQPVLYIVDLAPLVLGLTGFALGYFHARLLKTRHLIEETVHTRTAELEHALEDLSATQAEKDRFVASVSHELRTPLTSVVGLAHTLLDSSDDISPTDRSELLGLIASESEDVAAIVEDLLVAARVESGQLSVAANDLMLDEELCAMVEACKVEVEPLRIEPVMVTGDAVRIHQIVRNLITNAHRYGGESIAVAVYAEDDTAVLAVLDDGDGVPDEKAECIFAPFGKAHDDPQRTESVGLGLAVSRNLARLMNGDVRYRKRDGWTSFELHLPLVTQERDDRSTALLSTTEETVTYASTA
jgi:signal transduction histidine kinase